MIISEEEVSLRLSYLYDEIDNKIEKIERLNEDNIVCRCGCSACCIDDLTVFSVEADNILRNYESMLNYNAPHEEGGCAFLDDMGRCRIYESRPYVCRTQGLPLRWFDEDEKGNSVEYRDICPTNDNDDLMTGTDPDYFWMIGPYEERLFDLQHDLYNGNMKRIRLRDLFDKGKRIISR